MTLCEKCFMVVLTTLLAFFVVGDVLLGFAMRQDRILYNTRVAVMQQKLDNQNRGIRNILTQLSRTQTMEDVDVILNRANIQRVEVEKKGKRKR